MEAFIRVLLLLLGAVGLTSATGMPVATAIEYTLIVHIHCKLKCMCLIIDSLIWHC